MKKYQLYVLWISVSSLLLLKIIVRTHIPTSVSLIRWNNILYGVHFLVLAEAASPSKFGDFVRSVVRSVRIESITMLIAEFVNHTQ